MKKIYMSLLLGLFVNNVNASQEPIKGLPAESRLHQWMKKSTIDGHAKDVPASQLNQYESPNSVTHGEYSEDENVEYYYSDSEESVASRAQTPKKIVSNSRFISLQDQSDDESVVSTPIVTSATVALRSSVAPDIYCEKNKNRKKNKNRSAVKVSDDALLNDELSKKEEDRIAFDTFARKGADEYIKSRGMNLTQALQELDKPHLILSGFIIMFENMQKHNLKSNYWDEKGVPRIYNYVCHHVATGGMVTPAMQSALAAFKTEALRSKVKFSKNKLSSQYKFAEINIDYAERMQKLMDSSSHKLQK